MNPPYILLIHAGILCKNSCNEGIALPINRVVFSKRSLNTAGIAGIDIYERSVGFVRGFYEMSFHDLVRM
jgi:hypothetical protein